VHEHDERYAHMQDLLARHSRFGDVLGEAGSVTWFRSKSVQTFSQLFRLMLLPRYEHKY